MLGVEKSNDLLSRLHFSSSNRAKFSLRTMIQNLYSRLEMNFSKPKARLAMRTYSQNETWDDINKKREDDFMYDIFSCSLNSSQ